MEYRPPDAALWKNMAWKRPTTVAENYSNLPHFALHRFQTNFLILYRCGTVQKTSTDSDHSYDLLKPGKYKISSLLVFYKKIYANPCFRVYNPVGWGGVLSIRT